MDDLRWRERFISYRKCVLLLEKYVLNDNLNELERAGVVHQFELQFELALTVMNEFLVSVGVDVSTLSYSELIEEMFLREIIVYKQVWFHMDSSLEKTMLVYDDAIRDQLIEEIRTTFLPAFVEFANRIQES